MWFAQDTLCDMTHIYLHCVCNYVVAGGEVASWLVAGQCGLQWRGGHVFVFRFESVTSHNPNI